jgi:hypothetical protein
MDGTPDAPPAAASSSTPRGIQSLKEIDDIDTRREISILLNKLTQDERVEFLQWCCRQANDRIMVLNNPPWVMVNITNNTGEANETLLDLAILHAQFGFPLQFVLTELERRTAKARLLWLP